MTEKISTRTPELERRLEYAKRIRKAVDYKGTADHEDVQSILRKFQEEITKEFTDRIVERLEERKILCNEIVTEAIGMNDLQLQAGARNRAVAFKEAIEIVKGVQNE